MRIAAYNKINVDIPQNYDIIYLRRQYMAKYYHSTTALSKKLDVEVAELFSALQKLNLVVKENNQWQLTEDGKKLGGIVQKDETHGEYPAWPDTIPLESIKKELDKLDKESTYHLLTASKVGEKFNVEPRKMKILQFPRRGTVVSSFQRKFLYVWGLLPRSLGVTLI
jgi:hypothetical protein